MELNEKKAAEDSYLANRGLQGKQVWRHREVAGAKSQGCLRAVTMWPGLLPEKMSRCSSYRHKSKEVSEILVQAWPSLALNLKADI